MFILNDVWRLFSLVSLFTAIPVAIMIVLEKRSPYKTIAWILVLVLLPIVGVIFYLFFGQEYRKRKLFSRKNIKSLGKARQLSSEQLGKLNKLQLELSDDALAKENLIKLLLNNSNSLLTTGNKLQILEGGAQTFEAIIEAIKGAKHHIHLEYYIFLDDKIGNKLKTLLIEKSKSGVEVRIIIDDVGSWGLNKKFIGDCRENGVEIYSFMEVRFPRFTSKMNFRNHRKIVIVDGEIGFTGGINVADRYIDGLKGIGRWNDMHLRIEGDAVLCLQVVFSSDWYFMVNENLLGRNYFPPFTENAGVPVQISASGPDSDWQSISQAFFAAITNAREKVYVVSPYLMPPKSILSALEMTALSGVDVRIIIPEKSDTITPKWSSFSYVEELLEAGVKVYFYQDGFIHSKYMIVDSVFATIGTSNMDFRSLETNFEVNAFMYEKEFTNNLTKIFMADLAKSRQIKLEEWKQRPWHFKLRESLAHIVAPMM